MKKSIFLFGLKIIGAILSLVLGMVISRIYGVEIFGLFGLILTWSNIFSIIGCWGGNVKIIEKRYKIIPQEQILFFIFGAFLATLIGCIFFDYKYNLWYVGLIVFPLSFFIFKSSILMLHNRQYANSVIDDFLKYFLPLIFVLFFYFFFNYNEFFLVYISSIFFLFISSLFIVFSSFKLYKDEKKESLFSYVKYGWVPTCSALLILLNAQFDRIILSNIVSDKSLGYYTIAQSFTALITYISVSVMVVITPNLVKFYQEKEFIALHHLSRKYSLFLFAVSAVIFILTVVFGKLFFSLYGVTSQDGYLSLLILLFGVVLSQIFGFGMTIAAYTEDKSKLLSFQIIVFLTISICCYFMSVKWGILGAAISTASGYILMKFILWLYYKRKSINVGLI